MTATELAERLDKITSQASQRLEEKILSTQTKANSSVITVLKDLEVDKDGYIIQSQSNRKIIQKAANAFESSIKNGPYFDGIQQYVNTIPALDRANSAYFDFISQGYKPNAQYITSLKRDTITNLESLLMQDGLESQIKAPLLNILNQNINSSAKFTDLLNQVQEYIIGNRDVNGKLLQYSRQVTQDSLFNYSRAYQSAVSSDLNLQWFLYAGGLTRESKFSSGSRPFCIDRVTHYFHYTEIEKWASLDWSGKRRGTTSSSIFTFCGGYGCSHSLIPVSDSIVPNSDKKRVL